ncbi:MAG: G5 domain-containing protein, partial [Chloroflexi bacterium]|nr:G5 domain-containing protein [Chloroflexota bacterium]
MKRRTLFPITLLFLLASGCVAPQVTQSVISISIVADGQTHKITVPAGTTAQAAYTSAGITLNSLDRSDPPLYTVLTNGASLKLTRVREEFEVKDETIPFERQVVRNESLTDGETLLVQPGANGTQEITYRHLYEDGKETSVTIFKTVTLKEAVPEVLMVGVQAPFASVPLPGKLAYLIAGNAWVMQAST